VNIFTITWVRGIITKDEVVLIHLTTNTHTPPPHYESFYPPRYIQYPLPVKPVIPWNYCALARLVPMLKTPLSLVCDKSIKE
jgi:hypothetical protein